MIRDIETDEFEPCVCGHKPTSYSVGYGRTPYAMCCNGCGKQFVCAKCTVTGSPDNLIDYWNSHLSKMTKEELEAEADEFHTERKKVNRYGEYSKYKYYWYKDIGEHLVKISRL